MSYVGKGSLQKALEQLRGKKFYANEFCRLTDKHRERLNIPKGKAIKSPADRLNIYEFERDAMQQQVLPIDSLVALPRLEHPAPIPEVVPITQLVNDVVPIVEPAPLELNTTQSIDCDKFVSINYRHADNSRHTVQIERFYIDALKAIGIDDVSKFVAENAGLTQVTKNVKRAIVFELVRRATVVEK